MCVSCCFCFPIDRAHEGERDRVGRIAELVVVAVMVAGVVVAAACVCVCVCGCGGVLWRV